MNNSYLLEVIKVLKPTQCQEFSEYLASSLFNNGSNADDLRVLFRLIWKAAPDFSEDQLNKISIYGQVFPGQAPVQGKLEKLMMELNRLLRSFLLAKRYLSEKNELYLQTDWIAWLREEGLTNRAQTLLQKLKSQRKAETEESMERYRVDFVIAEENHELLSFQNQLNSDLDIPDLLDQLDLFYQNYRIVLLNRYFLQQKGVSLPDLPLQEKTPEHYSNNSLLYKASYKVFELLKQENPSPESFTELLDFLSEQEKYLEFETKRQLYTYLRNFCTILINNGQIAIVKILHQIHKDNLSRGLLLLNGKISPHSYLNIVQIAIRVKEYEWAKAFTEQYKSKIIDGDKDRFFYLFNLSHCLFAEKKFAEALDHLPEPTAHPHYHGTIRCLELKIYYEMQSELLQYKLFAFRKYFERTAKKNIPEKARVMYIEFSNVMLQLMQSPPKDKARSQRLIERIQKKKLLADRAWLLEKAAELG